MQKDQTTEQLIKSVAKKIFHEKGYGSTRTRDIAEAAGINTALLNYYFRSKENLFNIVMLESVQEMFSFIYNIVNDENTNLSHKIDAIVNRYTEVFTDNPKLPLFVLSEIQANPERLMNKSGIPRNILMNSYFFKQLEDQIKWESIDTTPLNIFLNIISLTIMPAIARPIMFYVHSMDNSEFDNFIDNRRKQIPVWIKGMLKLKEE